MFNKDFYPTPESVIAQMTWDLDLNNKVVLEPSAGKGDIVDFCQNSGANVIACEINEDLRTILQAKCKVISDDFLKITSDMVSHVDYIIMNPPFSAGEKHILHAWEVCPDGCEIIALCNAETVGNTYTRSRNILSNIITNYGTYENIGNVFSSAERKTNVEIGLIRITKPGSKSDFSEYFSDEDDEIEKQENGIMSYNAIREVVQRYVSAVKLYDEVLANAVKMNAVTSGIGIRNLTFVCREGDVPTNRQEFAKNLQKASWQWIFSKMDMGKFITRGVRDDINAFIEKQKSMKFTMKNIYKMLEIIIGTTSNRMDKALLEVFDKLTMHYHENRYSVEGWKTNSHYLVNQKFIKGNICWQDQRWYKGQSQIEISLSNDIIEDLAKALCFITGRDYDYMPSLYAQIKYNYKLVNSNGETIKAFYRKDLAEQEKDILSQKSIYCSIVYEDTYNYGEWFDWGFFECKAFKKGTMHFKFKDRDIWATFNQHIARIKGYPLPEALKPKK